MLLIGRKGNKTTQVNFCKKKKEFSIKKELENYWIKKDVIKMTKAKTSKTNTKSAKEKKSVKKGEIEMTKTKNNTKSAKEEEPAKKETADKKVEQKELLDIAKQQKPKQAEADQAVFAAAKRVEEKEGLDKRYQQVSQKVQGTCQTTKTTATAKKPKKPEDESTRVYKLVNRLLFYATKIACHQGRIGGMVLINLTKLQNKADSKTALLKQTILSYQNGNPAIVIKYHKDGRLSAEVLKASENADAPAMTLIVQLKTDKGEALTKAELLNVLNKYATNDIIYRHWSISALKG